MIRCTRVHQPTGYFCTPWRQPWTNAVSSTNVDCRCIFVDGFRLFFLSGAASVIYRRFLLLNGGAVWRGLSFFSLDGTLSFLILVGIHEALGTRTLSFNFLYTILFDFLAVQSVLMSSCCKCGVGGFADYSGLHEWRGYQNFSQVHHGPLTFLAENTVAKILLLIPAKTCA